MKKIITPFLGFLVCILFISTPISCRNSPDTVSCFPQNHINVTLNLNLPAYQTLNIVGGWQYINEQTSGTQGLIIVKTQLGFKIYDRNAPHLCPDNNTILRVVDNIKIVCPKDGAEWMLLTGEMLKIANVPPKTYNNYTYDPIQNILTIYQ